MPPIWKKSVTTGTHWRTFQPRTRTSPSSSAVSKECPGSRPAAKSISARELDGVPATTPAVTSNGSRRCPTGFSAKAFRVCQADPESAVTTSRRPCGSAAARSKSHTTRARRSAPRFSSSRATISAAARALDALRASTRSMVEAAALMPRRVQR